MTISLNSFRRITSKTKQLKKSKITIFFTSNILKHLTEYTKTQVMNLMKEREREPHNHPFGILPYAVISYNNRKNTYFRKYVRKTPRKIIQRKGTTKMIHS